MAKDEGSAQFGMIGLAVMGENLALNVQDHGYSVAVWNREPETVTKFVKKHEGKKFVGTKTLEAFTKALERPRRIMMMIKAGDPVDQTIEKLLPYLEKDDIIIDGGNSWFEDTQRRTKYLEEKGFHFVGSGVSGGEEGARFGPSLMPGGSKQSYKALKPIFESIAAKTDSGACVAHCGPDGAGHFVKMVHNGIEYGDMQLIAEAYDLLHRGAGLESGELAETFDSWNKGPLESFLIEITSNIFRVKDDKSGKPLVDAVLDKAGQKGTGKWTAQIALDLGIPIPTLTAAVDARALSSMKEERVEASKVISGPDVPRFNGDKKAMVQDVHDALYASKICAYAQGMSLIAAGSKENKWDIDLGEMARIWKGGCIIRARFLDDIRRAFEKNAKLKNLLLDDDFNSRVESAQEAWRRVVMNANKSGIPVPAFSASLAYFDSYRTPRLPQNLTQAQRDYFGSHTYQRVDAPTGDFVHTDWTAKAGVKQK